MVLRVVAVLALTGCSLEPLTREELFGLPSLVPKVRLTGAASNARTGAPLADVAVTLASASVVTDDSGAFLLEGLALGDFDGSAVREGFERRDFRVTLVEGTNRLNLELTPVPCASCARLSGTVRDSVTNQPVSQATVTVGSQSVRSSDAGEYSVAGLAEGRVTGFVVKPGHQRADFDVTLSAGPNAFDVALTRLPCGGCSQGLVCNVAQDVCQQPATVTTTVLDACTGAGVSARVVIQGQATCSSASRGFVMLSGLAPGGPHTMAVGKTGYRVSNSTVTLSMGFNAVPEVRLERVLGCAAPLQDEPCTCSTPECQ